MESQSILTDEVITRIVPFASKSAIVLGSINLEKFYNRTKECILENMVKYIKMGSNCVVSAIIKIEINMIDYNPLSARSYIPLDLIDPDLIKKKAIINIKNEDNECFKWCVTRALNMKSKSNERVDEELIEKSKELNWDGIDFPVSDNQIKKFEKNNEDIGIYVFYYKDEHGKIHPLRKSKYPHRKHIINLFLISHKDKSHYCLIKNLSRLLSSQSSQTEHKNYYCRNCLQGYYSEEALSKHFPYCNEHGCVRIELPKEGSTMYFKDYSKKMRVPFVIYAFINPINTCAPNTNTSYTKQYQKHTPSSYCYYIKCFDKSVYKSKLVTYTAFDETDDAAQLFVNSLEKEVKRIYNKILKIKKNKIKNQEDIDHFNSATTCHICEEELDGDKIWDHCHITGKYRGAAHNKCNLNYQIPEFFPVLFHNLSGYDSHLFIKKLGGKLKCIPNNEEKYISFSKEIKVYEYIKNGKVVDVN